MEFCIILLCGVYWKKSEQFLPEGLRIYYQDRFVLDYRVALLIQREYPRVKGNNWFNKDVFFLQNQIW